MRLVAIDGGAVQLWRVFPLWLDPGKPTYGQRAPARSDDGLLPPVTYAVPNLVLSHACELEGSVITNPEPG